MRRFFLAGALLLAACGGKPVPGGYIKPSLRVSGPRMAMVGRPVGVMVLLYGDYPQGEIGLEISAGSRTVQVPFARAIVDTAVSRVYRYRLTFTHSFYWRLWFEERDNLIGEGWLTSRQDASCAEANCPWDEMVILRARVHEVEILPGGGVMLGRMLAEEKYSIKLSCYDCQTEELNEVRGSRG